MKRTGALQRKTRLVTKKPMARDACELKRTRIKPVSVKKRASLNTYLPLRKAFLEEHPVCVRCWQARSVEVDHIAPVGEAPDGFLDQSNWQALCQACHAWKHRNPDAAEADGFYVRGDDYRRVRAHAPP